MNFSLFRSCVIAIAALGASGALEAFAQDSWPRAVPPQRMTLRDAIELTANTNPKLAGHVHTRSAADARRRQAAQRPPLELGADVENIFGTGSLGTLDDFEATLSLGTVIELGGKRASRMTQADRALQALEARQHMERLDIIADVARRFVDVLHAQAAYSIARENREDAGKVRDVMSARLAIAASNMSDVKNAEVVFSRARLEEIAAQTDHRVAWATLVSLWGGSPESRVDLAGDLLDTPQTMPFAEIMELLDGNPELAVLAAEKAQRVAAVDAALSLEAPDIAVSAGVRRLQSLREQALVLSASIPLGSATRAGPAADEARHELAAVESDLHAERDHLTARLFSVHARLLGAREGLETLTRQGIPAAQAALNESDTLFRSGQISLFELTAAQKQLLDLRHAAIDAARDYHTAVIDIERLTGVPMTASASLSNSQASMP